MELQQQQQQIDQATSNTASSVAASFKRKKIQRTTVTDSVGLELDSYAAGYSGHAKIDRLLFIAETCPQLQVEALKLAIVELKACSLDTQRYVNLLQSLNSILASRGLPELSTDQQWVDASQKTAKSTLDRLELELKSYRNNQIRESIRMGLTELAEHYHRCGDLVNAFKNVTKSRDFCTSPKHIVDMYLSTIKIAFELNNLTGIVGYCNKIEQTPDFLVVPHIVSKLKCASALAYLDGARYKQCAQSLLEVVFVPDVSFSSVMSNSDIAMYACLCSLVSYERRVLKEKVIENAIIKNYLDPTIRVVLESFFSAKYETLFTTMDKVRNDLLLDMFLHPHVDTLLNMIRSKAVLQYCAPFDRIIIPQMATLFGRTYEAMESELALLIQQDQLVGRIDRNSKTISLRAQNKRSAILKQVEGLEASYARIQESLLLRTDLLRKEIEIVVPQTQLAQQ